MGGLEGMGLDLEVFVLQEKKADGVPAGLDWIGLDWVSRMGKKYK